MMVYEVPIKGPQLCPGITISVHEYAVISMIFSLSCYWQKLCTVTRRISVQKPCLCSQQHRRKQVLTFKVVCVMETPAVMQKPCPCSQQHGRKQVFTFTVVCVMETPTIILLSATQKEAGIHFQSCLYYGNSHLYPALSNAEGSRYLLSRLGGLANCCFQKTSVCSFDFVSTF